MKMYLSGCGWNVLNTWSVWKNERISSKTTHMVVATTAFPQEQEQKKIVSVGLSPRRSSSYRSAGAARDFFPSHLSVQTLLQCPYSPRVQSHASASVRTLRIPNTGSHTGAQELCQSRGGRPGLPVPNKPTVSADVKQHFNQAIPLFGPRKYRTR